MEESSVTAFESDRTQIGASDDTVERLEFGKFCVSADGPIESNRENIPIEHSQLGWSEGFPKDLIPVCYPTKLGIMQEDGEALPLDNVHGTVLRPVIRGTERRARQVFYRVRARAEEGEGKSGRRYTLARYLADYGEQVNPLTMLATMNSVPFGGIIRAEAGRIGPIGIEPMEPELDHVGHAFLREALIYILSGVALSIIEEISEMKFFTWVAAVHDRLPPTLRPYLSAGWNVGSSYSGKLGITYTTHRAGSTALFSPTALTWSSPEYVTTWKAPRQPVVNGFFEERLEPGQLFEKYVFNEAGLAQSSEERGSTLIDSLPPVDDLPELPGFDDAGTVRIFRYPGLQARDQFTIRALADWLENGTGEEPARISLDARELSYQTNRRRALKLILQALSKPASRPRADRALWLSVVGRIPPSFTNVINAASGSGADRARLLAAVARGEVIDALRALTLALTAETENLADNVKDELFNIINESLSPANRTTLPFHERMLVCPSPPYREWVEQHALELMSALASQEKISEETFAAIARINGADTVNELYRLITRQTPTPQSINLLSNLSPTERGVFVDFFNREWTRKDEQTIERRKALLSWFPPLKSEHITHPLLCLISGSKLTDSDVDEIADDVESRHVPDPMFPNVAVLALERWAVVGRRITSNEGCRRWVDITNLWPRNYAEVLGSNPGTRSPLPEIARAARNLTMSFTELQRLITARFVDGTFAGAAPLLWDLAVRLGPQNGSPLSVFDLCASFVNGQLPDGPFPIADLPVFIQLVKESRHDDLGSKTVQRMWQSASQYWQVRLLLTVFPYENLVPSPAQLSLLIPNRDWLRDHLRSSPALRRNAFELATQSFHSLKCQKSPLWREDFVAHPIWAAFSGVPVGLLPQDALRVALRTYTQPNTRPTAEQPVEIIEQQAWLCCTFLDSYRNAASESLAVHRVLDEFLLPFLSYRWNRKALEDGFNFVGAAQELPDYKAPNGITYTFSPNIKELMRRIVRFCNQKALTQVIRNFYKNLKYAARDRNK